MCQGKYALKMFTNHFESGSVSFKKLQYYTDEMVLQCFYDTQIYPYHYDMATHDACNDNTHQFTLGKKSIFPAEKNRIKKHIIEAQLITKIH